MLDFIRLRGRHEEISEYLADELERIHDETSDPTVKVALQDVAKRSYELIDDLVTEHEAELEEIFARG